MRSGHLSRGGKVVFAAALVLLLTALAIDHPFPSLAGGGALALLLVSWPGGRSLARIEFLRLPPARLLEDEVRELELEYRLQGIAAPLAFTLKSPGPAVELEGGTPALVPTTLGRFPLRVKALKRGHHERVAFECLARGALGLFPRRRVGEVATDLWILPRPRALRERVLEEMLSLRPRGLDLPQPTGPGEGEFYALRFFREGDPERRVHARLSARRGRKVVRIFRGEAPPLVHLVIDLRVGRSGRAFGQGDFDEAMRFAAGVVRTLLRRNVPVSLSFVHGTAVETVVPPSCRDLDAYLGALALVQPFSVKGEPGQPPLPAVGDGRRVLLHLGMVDERQVPRDWLVIQAGSRRYFQLLDMNLAASVVVSLPSAVATAAGELEPGRAS